MGFLKCEGPTVSMDAGHFNANACPVCQSLRRQTVCEKDRHGGRLQTVICLDCGLYRTHPLPCPEALRAFYETEYRRLYKGSAKPRLHRVIRAAQAARERIRRLLPYLPSRRKWLEIGAGSGEFAFLMQRLGHEMEAVEPDRSYSEFLRQDLGLKARQAFLEDLPSSLGPYDGIAFFHVLEHHPDPCAALRRLASLLTGSGVLAVETPNVAAPYCHPASRFHRAHVVHFSLRTLEYAAARAGLQPVEMQASEDGGVLWAVFRRGRELSEPPGVGAASELLEAESRRSRTGYYLNPDVWARTGQRLVRMAAQRCMALHYASARDYLMQVALPGLDRESRGAGGRLPDPHGTAAD